jgi:hypothetical protein
MTTSGSFTPLHPHLLPWVMPLPLSIIFCVVQQCKAENTNCSLTIADMITLGFFYLLRASEYAQCHETPLTPLQMKDVHLFVGSCPTDFSICSDEQFSNITGASLEFHSKKNGNQSQLISLPMSGDMQWCPVLTLANRIHHLRRKNGSPETPLYAYKDGPTWKNITTSMIKTHLCAAATTMGYHADDTRRISANSIRAAGHIALLSQGVDPFLIQLLFRH